MSVNGGQPLGLFYIYGFKGEAGPYYAGGASSLEQAIAHATAAKESKRWTRTVADDVYTNARVWDSEGGRD